MAVIIVAGGGNLFLVMLDFMKPWSVLMFSATMTRDPLQVWPEVGGSYGAVLPNERLLLSLRGSPAFRVRHHELKSCRGNSLIKLMSEGECQVSGSCPSVWLSS